jgi:hypothetical protein
VEGQVEDFITRYYRLEKMAIKARLITKKDSALILRRHTRKHGYWGRHFRDLQEVIRDRIEWGRGNHLTPQVKAMLPRKDE